MRPAAAPKSINDESMICFMTWSRASLNTFQTGSRQGCFPPTLLPTEAEFSIWPRILRISAWLS